MLPKVARSAGSETRSARCKSYAERMVHSSRSMDKANDRMEEATTDLPAETAGRTRAHRRRRPGDAHRPGRARAGLGLPDRRSGRRRGGASARSPPSGRRSSSATSSCRGWAATTLLRTLKDQLSRHHVHPADRAGHGRERGRSDQGRRLRLSDQAGRSAAAADPAAEGGRAAGDAARGRASCAGSCASRAASAASSATAPASGRSTASSSRRRRRRRRC